MLWNLHRLVFQDCQSLTTESIVIAVTLSKTRCLPYWLVRVNGKGSDTYHACNIPRTRRFLNNSNSFSGDQYSSSLAKLQKSRNSHLEQYVASKSWALVPSPNMAQSIRTPFRALLILIVETIDKLFQTDAMHEKFVCPQQWSQQWTFAATSVSQRISDKSQLGNFLWYAYMSIATLYLIVMDA